MIERRYLSRVYILTFWLILLVIIFSTASPIALRPPVMITVNLDRGLAFAGLSMFAMLAYPKRVATTLFASIALPSVIEASQFLSATRHPHLLDVYVKSIGAALGCLFAYVVLAISKQISLRGAKP
ncbi:VanZ family protein [Neorhizobium sp. NCHU2750]|uniref:VanZ family protein n=1 Tax=Neorhizobium sp. NCHU2750 TaxID=1825976 RepID=UPI0013C42597